MQIGGRPFRLTLLTLALSFTDSCGKQEESKAPSLPPEKGKVEIVEAPSETGETEKETERELTGLEGAARSQEELAQKVVEALNSGDVAALHVVRVNQAEYMQFLFPQFPAAEPDRTVPVDFHWFLLNNKSIKAARRAIAEHGGRDMTFVEIQSDPEVDDYGTFELINQVRLKVRTPNGEEEWLSFLGSIVSLDGRYKMLSYRD